MSNLKNEFPRRLVAGAVVAMLGWSVPAAWAVDVINTDATVREIVVNGTDGESKVVTIAAKKKIADVCDSCVILLGRDSVEVDGATSVKISGGKLSVQAK